MTGLLAQIRGIPVPTPLEGFDFLGTAGSHGGPPIFNNPSLIGELVSRLLLYAIIIAGMIFLVKLIMAGFGYLTSAGDSGKIAASSKNLLNAAIGLFLVLTTFFIAQILQVIFGIQIL